LDALDGNRPPVSGIWPLQGPKIRAATIRTARKAEQGGAAFLAPGAAVAS
jgi:hypothetical protein